MSPPGRPKGEYRKAQPEGARVSPPGRPKGEYRKAQPEGAPLSPLGRRLYSLTLACLACLGMAGCQTAPLSQRELIRDHLAKLIGAEPAPCGEVKSYARQQRLQYRVECGTGDVYGVGVAPDGRVSVTPQAGSKKP